MASKEHIVSELCLTKHSIRDGLSAVLHTILFIRSPINQTEPYNFSLDVKSKKVNCNYLEHLTYTACDNTEVQNNVDVCIDHFFKSIPTNLITNNAIIQHHLNNFNNINNTTTSYYTLEIHISFTKKKEKKNLFNIFSSDILEFEIWKIPIKLLDYYVITNSNISSSYTSLNTPITTISNTSNNNNTTEIRRHSMGSANISIQPQYKESYDYFYVDDNNNSNMKARIFNSVSQCIFSIMEKANEDCEHIPQGDYNFCLTVNNKGKK